MSEPSATNKWDSEYESRGIPSSFRDDPSGTLVWVLANWALLTGNKLPNSAVDIGCGTGRNPLYMAELGIDVLGFDDSQVAVAKARQRPTPNSQGSVKFLHHNLDSGIPADHDQFDLATDIFVYKHQLLPSARSRYRRELRRVLRPNGRVMLSLADRTDGYYDQCPDLKVAEAGNPRTIEDPVVNIGSVLFTLEELIVEMGDCFALDMSWHKSKMGVMHGKQYLRRTLATIWRARD